MDVISNKFAGRGRGDVRGVYSAEDTTSGELWKKIMFLFDDDIDEHGVLSVEFIMYNVFRAFTAIFIIPLWFIVGLVTFGQVSSGSLWCHRVLFDC